MYLLFYSANNELGLDERSFTHINTAVRSNAIDLIERVMKLGERGLLQYRLYCMSSDTVEDYEPCIFGSPADFALDYNTELNDGTWWCREILYDGNLIQHFYPANEDELESEYPDYPDEPIYDGFTIGDKVHWHDPAVESDDSEEYEIICLGGDCHVPGFLHVPSCDSSVIATISSNGCDSTECYLSELTHV